MASSRPCALVAQTMDEAAVIRPRSDLTQVFLHLLANAEPQIHSLNVHGDGVTPELSYDATAKLNGSPLNGLHTSRKIS